MSVSTALILCAHVARSESPAKIDYNLHIRPILAENCFKCHGADEKQRKGKLRLDVREEALAKKAIIPGKPDESEAIKRLITTDEDDMMPPPKEHRKINDADRALLSRWITEGADYKKHWAFIPPVKSPVPEIQNSKFKIQNPIDAFILTKLDDLKLNPAPPASKEQWLRRVTFALTGLPPSLEEMNQFLADESPQAREQVVDRLLQSPAYGEHIAKDWLDAARYADSYGRHEDGDMVTWPWRDWVIKSFNDNLPFDQFIIQQSAGDLLPNPTRDHLVATAFNRLALQSNESGNDPEEFRLDQVSDRVRANGLAFMGLSIECAKCHDHKYDPISQKEYWQMAAFFDNIDENGVYSQFCPQTIPSPSLLMPTAEQQSKLNDLQKQITAKDQAVQKIKNDARADFARWVASNNVPGALRNGAWNTVKSWFGGGDVNPLAYRAEGHFDFDITPQKPGDHRSLTNAADSKRPAKLRIKLETIKGAVKDGALMNGDDEVTFSKMGEYHQYDSFSFALWLQPREKRNRAVILSWSRGGNDDGRGYEVIMQEEIPSFALMHFQPGNEIRIKARKPLPLNEWTHLAVTYDGSSRAEGLKMFINGAPAEVDVVHDNLQLDIVRRKEWGDIDLDQIRFNLGGREHDSPLKNCGVDELWVFDRDISTGEVKYLAGKETKPDDWFDYWIQKEHKPWLIASAELKRLREMHTGVMNDVLEMMIMQELSVPRKWHVHPRGDFRQLAEEVQPDVPKNVLPFSSELPRNRLGFARWLVSKEHPLTARVEVNRVWQMFFGRGLVGTPQDFGTRGDLPSHPDLLDWLACDFMEHNWDVKRLCRMIAITSTFAQSGTPADAQTITNDPENRLLARGPRTRLSAEEVRDQALATSGLLCSKIGGPSAHPYMPEGLYHESGLPQKYVEGTGDDLYRRSMYSFWRRTLPPPELAAFDAPSREYCVVKREKTNTPLQALVLLNGPQFVETQRMLAERVMKLEPADEKTRCATAFRLLTSRKPADTEIAVMCKILQTQRDYFQAHPQEALDLRTNGRHPADASLPPAEVAATSMLIRSLMSHLESVTR